MYRIRSMMVVIGLTAAMGFALTAGALYVHGKPQDVVDANAARQAYLAKHRANEASGVQLVSDKALAH